MAVTIVEIINWGSQWKKVVVFEHKEDLGVFREKIHELAVAAVDKRVKEGTVNPLSFDDIWTDIEKELPVSRNQVLNLADLLGLSKERTIITGISTTRQEKKDE